MARIPVPQSVRPAPGRAAPASLIAACALLFIALAAWDAKARAEPEVRIERKDNMFRIEARVRVDAHHHFAWEVLTDYGNSPGSCLAFRPARS